MAASETNTWITHRIIVALHRNKEFITLTDAVLTRYETLAALHLHRALETSANLSLHDLRGR